LGYLIFTKYNDKNGRIVEAPIGLNYINIYSLDGSFAKTICMDKELNNITNIQNTEETDRIYTFANLRVYDDFFGVVYINEDELTYQTGRKKLPSILLFDWDGNPFVELKLDHHIQSFDIDLLTGELYTLDRDFEEFYKYDIKNIMVKL
jgi:hypothetical protein